MAIVTNFGIKAANQEIVSLQRAKDNSNIDHEYRDELFQLYLAAIETEIENYIGGPVMYRENTEIWVNPWQQSIPVKFQVNEIASIVWIGDNEAETEITDYDVFPGEITLGIEKPEGFKRLKITCSAGWEQEEIPKDIQMAALLMFSERETYRENRPLKYNLSAQNLLRPYKLY